VHVPIQFDARDAWPMCNGSISRVRDQGVCGACWAFGAVEALEDRFCIASSSSSTTAAFAPSEGVPLSQSRPPLRLSPEYLVSCASKCDGCDGGYVDEAWRFLRDHGVDDEACTPYMQVGERE
jgi:cathepsin B